MVNIFNKEKRGQALPLNTIVIAMLVIIVLLVIVVFFTSSVGKSGEIINQNSPNSCSLSNPIISTLGYDQVKYTISSDGKGCTSPAEKIKVIPSLKGNLNGQEVTIDNEDGATIICCGTKE